MNFKIAVLPGDGIGPEVTDQAIKVLNAVGIKYGHEFKYNFADVGAIAIDNYGDPLPEATLETCLESDALLFGAIGHPKYDNDPSAKVRPEQGLLKLRKSLGLFANIRPVKAYDLLISKSPLKEELIKGVDIVVYRELTSGIYFGEKGRTETGAFDHCTYERYEIERIAHKAFEAAQLRSKKVTLIDKANVLETSRLWREVVSEIAVEYPDVVLDMMFVDNAAMQMILNPKQFDVILTENMFGDIISDESSVISGSLGMLPSASIGAKTSMFEPIHGSFPQAAGKNIANPMATILSAAMMMDHLGLANEAIDIREAVNAAMKEGIVTEDLDAKNNFSTQQVGDYIADFIEEKQATSKIKKDYLTIGLSTII